MALHQAGRLPAGGLSPGWPAVCGRVLRRDPHQRRLGARDGPAGAEDRHGPGRGWTGGHPSGPGSPGATDLPTGSPEDGDDRGGVLGRHDRGRIAAVETNQHGPPVGRRRRGHAGGRWGAPRRCGGRRHVGFVSRARSRRRGGGGVARGPARDHQLGGILAVGGERATAHLARHGTDLGPSRRDPPSERRRRPRRRRGRDHDRGAGHGAPSNSGPICRRPIDSAGAARRRGDLPDGVLRPGGRRPRSPHPGVHQRGGFCPRRRAGGRRRDPDRSRPVPSPPRLVRDQQERLEELAVLGPPAAIRRHPGQSTREDQRPSRSGRIRLGQAVYCFGSRSTSGFPQVRVPSVERCKKPVRGRSRSNGR